MLGYAKITSCYVDVERPSFDTLALREMDPISFDQEKVS